MSGNKEHGVVFSTLESYYVWWSSKLQVLLPFCAFVPFTSSSNEDSTKWDLKKQLLFKQLDSFLTSYAHTPPLTPCISGQRSWEFDRNWWLSPSQDTIQRLTVMTKLPRLSRTSLRFYEENCKWFLTTPILLATAIRQRIKKEDGWLPAVEFLPCLQQEKAALETNSILGNEFYTWEQ